MAQNAPITINDGATPVIFKPQSRDGSRAKWLEDTTSVPVAQRRYVSTNLRPATSTEKRKTEINIAVPYLGSDGITVVYASAKITLLVDENAPVAKVTSLVNMTSGSLANAIIADIFTSGSQPY